MGDHWPKVKDCRMKSYFWMCEMLLDSVFAPPLKIWEKRSCSLPLFLKLFLLLINWLSWSYWSSPHLTKKLSVALFVKYNSACKVVERTIWTPINKLSANLVFITSVNKIRNLFKEVWTFYEKARVLRLLEISLKYELDIMISTQQLHTAHCAQSALHFASNEIHA